MARGRPVGSKNKASQFKSYQPKRWLPWMDALVLASLTNDNAEELAVEFNITKQHVSNILSTEQAKHVREQVREALLKKSSNVEERLARIREKSLERMEKFIEADGYAQSQPFAFADRAMAMFKLTGASGPESVSNDNSSQTIINGNILVANPEIMNRLTKGLEISNQVKELHSGSTQEVKVVTKPELVRESA